MLPEEIEFRLKQLVEDVEAACNDVVKDFWEDVDAMGDEYDHNELTKEVLNAVEHVFTKDPDE